MPLVGALAVGMLALPLGGLGGAGASSSVTVLPDDGTTKGGWSVSGPGGRTYTYGTFAYVLPNAPGQGEYEVGGDLTAQPSLDETGGPGFGDGGYTGEHADYRVHGPSEVAEERVLELPGGTERRATACFGPTVTVTLPLPAGDHRVAVYVLDYDRSGRVQTVVTGAGASVDSHTVADAREGVYLFFAVHSDGSPVTITTQALDGPNAVVSGVFVDPLGSSTTGVTFTGVDTTTQGNWIGVHGASGHLLCGAAAPVSHTGLAWSPALDLSAGLGAYTVAGHVYSWGDPFPNAVAVGPAYAWAWTDWASQSAGDPRWVTFWKFNPLVGGATTPGDRRATAWDSGDDVTPSTSGARPLIVDVHVPANSSDRYCGFELSFYFYDHDANRVQDLVLRDTTDGGSTVVDSRRLSAMAGGVYARYAVDAGTDLSLELRRVEGVNAILNGIFWDEVPCGPDASELDPRTPGYWGNWKNHYTQAQFQALLDGAKASFAPLADLTVQSATSMLKGNAKKMSDQLRRHFLAMALNLEAGFATGAGVLDLTQVAGAPALFGGSTASLAHVMSTVSGAWGSWANPWGGWSRTQQEVAKDVLDLANNFDPGGSGIFL